MLPSFKIIVSKFISLSPLSPLLLRKEKKRKRKIKNTTSTTKMLKGRYMEY